MSSQPLHVLLADDEPLARSRLRTLLAECGPPGATVVGEAATGAEVIDWLQTHAGADACDLVLLDIQMPGLDGLQTARQLRALQAGGRLPHFPLVALTAHALPGDRDTSLAAGMDDHLTKPIRLEHLQQAVARHLPSAASGSSPG